MNTPTALTAKPLTLSALIGLCTLLSACSLIPAQEVGNPLGLNGTALQVKIGSPAASISAQATGSATASGSFGDISTPISPATFTLQQPLSATATLSVPSGSLPQSISLSNLNLTVKISDAGGQVSFQLQPSGTATLTQTSGNNYSLSTTSFSATLSGALMGQLNPILTGGGTNSVSATLTLTATSTPDLPAGSSLNLSFAGGTGKVSF